MTPRLTISSINTDVMMIIKSTGTVGYTKSINDKCNTTNIILNEGNCTRLWSISHTLIPKQFINFLVSTINYKLVYIIRIHSFGI